MAITTAEIAPIIIAILAPVEKPPSDDVAGSAVGVEEGTDVGADGTSSDEVSDTLEELVAEPEEDGAGTVVDCDADSDEEEGGGVEVTMTVVGLILAEDWELADAAAPPVKLRLLDMNWFSSSSTAWILRKKVLDVERLNDPVDILQMKLEASLLRFSAISSAKNSSYNRRMDCSDL